MFESNNKSDIQVDWTPLKGGGASFATRKLVEVSPSRYEFKPTIWAILFSLIFIILPLMMGGFLLSFFRNHSFFIDTKDPTMLIFVVLPVIFIIIGVLMLIYFLKPVVFDKSVGLFWRGFHQPSPVYGGNKRKKAVRIEEIHGLQIVKELVQGKNSFTSYELNMVLNNGERVNIIDHGSLQKVKKDAQKLGLFLGVPVWDQMSGV